MLQRSGVKLEPDLKLVQETDHIFHFYPLFTHLSFSATSDNLLRFKLLLFNNFFLSLFNTFTFLTYIENVSL